MDADERRDELNRLSETIIGCAFKVSNVLGSGFLEKVYENALVHEVRGAMLTAEQQVFIPVRYDGVVVGEYVADILVDRSVLIEVKAVKGIDEVHMAQCLNYLKATGLTLCLLLNFGTPKLQMKRLVHHF